MPLCFYSGKETHVERQKRVAAFELPDDKDGEECQPDHKGGDDLGLSPAGRGTTGEGEGSEEEPKGDDHEEDTDDVKLPKEGGEDAHTLSLEGRAVVGERARPASFDLGVGQDADEGETRD